MAIPGVENMVGLVLSPEQIRAAPPEVRHWLEQQVAQTFGLPRAAPPAPSTHLVACTPDQAGSILGEIQDSLPVITVFFELGREQGTMSHNGLRVFRLADIARHAHLPNVDTTLAALRVIDGAFKQAAGDRQAALYALDPQGNCYVADGTSQSILALWHSMVAAEPLAPQQGAMIPEAPRASPPG
ncbi:MAG TPA: hypothetical protein VJY39_05790 [Acidisphaera sp.]|nr:hypothetical protein [Acidisphaera sp.]